MTLFQSQTSLFPGQKVARCQELLHTSEQRSDRAPGEAQALTCHKKSTSTALPAAPRPLPGHPLAGRHRSDLQRTDTHRLPPAPPPAPPWPPPCPTRPGPRRRSRCCPPAAAGGREGGGGRPGPGARRAPVAACEGEEGAERARPGVVAVGSGDRAPLMASRGLQGRRAASAEGCDATRGIK